MNYYVLLCKILGGDCLIDFDLEIKRMQPINIKEMELNRYKIDDSIKKSIVLYNIAIGEIKKGNLELAINNLKKALSYNKGFSEAIKLTGLCYVNMKEYKKAEKIFKKLTKDSIYNELAYEYMQSLIIKKAMPKNINNIEEVKYIFNSKKKQPIAAKRSKGKIIISLLIVTIVIAGVSINYFYPLTIQGVITKFPISIQGVIGNFQANNKIVDSEEETDNNLDEDDTSLEENTIAHEDYKNAQKNAEDTKLELDNNKNNIVSMLNDVEKSFKDANYEKAASTLISMKSMNFDDETKTKFDKLWQDLKPDVLWTIYNQGNKLYKQKNYIEALPKLKIASEIDPNLDLMPWITFQIGMCYKETNDNANALIYFKQVKDNYPKSNYVSNAKMMISQIEKY
jgi:tetratricopeptide (TPR) repeat protein